MNEQLRELQLKAIEYADSVVPASRRYNDIYYDIVSAKLAELIVMECTNMLPEDDIRDKNGVHMFYVIREHFGVQ